MNMENDERRLRPCLCFDLGGVLIRNAVFTGLPALLPAGQDLSVLRQRWLHSSVIRRFESGLCSADEFAQAFVQEWDLSISASEFLQEFYRWPEGFYAGVAETLHALRPHYQLACLSNSNALHWSKFADSLSVFDTALSSHQLGIMKPDRGIFDTAAAQLQRAPQHIWFFDDMAENVHAAQAAGWCAWQVQAWDGTRTQLAALGVPV